MELNNPSNQDGHGTLYFRVTQLAFCLGILLFGLATGCGGASSEVYADKDTLEGEEFLRNAEKDWSEVKLMASPEYWKERGEPFVAANIKAKIHKIQSDTTEHFQRLLDQRKLSSGQAQRYFKVLKDASGPSPEK